MSYGGHPTIPNLTAITPAIAIGRASGQAPLVVQVHGADTAATFSDGGAAFEAAVGRPFDPFLDLEFAWDFGDSGGTETLTHPVYGTTVNANVDQTGPEAAYAYRTAGSYTLTLTVRAWTGSAYVTASTTTLIVHEVQQVRLTGSPTGGTYTLTLGGDTTDPIAYNATPATVRAALEALSTIGAGNVRETGYGLYFEFIGTLAGTDVALLTGDGSGLTGGTTPGVAIRQIRAGATETGVTCSAWAGTDRYFDSAYAGENGASDGTIDRPYAAFADLKSWLNESSDRRALLKRGSSWDASTAVRLGYLSARVRIEAYGSGAAPLLYATSGQGPVQGSTGFADTGSDDVVFSGIHLRANPTVDSDAGSLWVYAGDNGDATGWYNAFRDWSFLGCTFGGQAASQLNAATVEAGSRWTFWRCDFYRDGTTKEGHQGLLIGLGRGLAVVGGSFAGGDGDIALAHHIYPTIGDHSLYRWIDFQLATSLNFCVNTNCRLDGIDVPHVLFDGCDITGTQNGIEAANSSGIAALGRFDQFVIQHCAFHVGQVGIQGWAVYADCLERAVVRDSAFWSNPAGDLAIGDAATQLAAYRNRFDAADQAEAVGGAAEETATLYFVSNTYGVTGYPQVPATITSATSGDAGTGATWVGGVAPTSWDTAVIAAGHTVTVSDARGWATFSIPDTGCLRVVSGGVLTITEAPSVPGDTADTGPRILLEAGGILQGDPGAGSLRMVTGTSGQQRYAKVKFAGALGNRAILRKKPGAVGAFAWTVPNWNETPPGTGNLDPIEADHFEITGLSELTLAAYKLGHPGSRLTMRNGTVDMSQASTAANAKPFHLAAAYGGVYTIEDVLFADGSGQVLSLYFSGNEAAGTSTWKRNVIEQATTGLTTLGSNACGMEAEDNVYLGAVYAYVSDGLIGFLDGAFCYATADEQEVSTWNVGGTHENVYLHMNYGETEPTQGNPHFIGTTAPLTLTNAVFDFRGGNSVDIGDIVDGGAATIRNALVLKAVTTNGTYSLASGQCAALGDVGNSATPIGPFYLDRCTVYGTGLMFPHADYTGPAGRVRVKESLVWGDPDYAAFVRLLHCETFATTEDTADPAENTGNAIWNAGTFSNNTVNGVPGQTLKGFEAVNLSAAPAVLDLDASGGPDFVDAGRNFIRWCREERSHAGTDAEVITAGIADITADPTLTRLSLLPWVRAGYAPQNSLMNAGLADDPLSGTWIGAVEGVGAATLTIRGNATAPVLSANLYETTEAVTWSVTAGDATIDPDTGLLTAGDTPGSVTVRAESVGTPGVFGLHTLTVHAYDVPATGRTGPFIAGDPGYLAADYLTPALGDRPLLPALGPLAPIVTPSRHLPVSPYDAAIMEFFRTGAGTIYGLKAGDAMDFRWGSNGMGFNVVDSATQPFVAIDYTAPPGGSDGLDIFHSDPGPWPIPDDARLQSNPGTDPPGSAVNGDQHLLVLDAATGYLYEAYEASKPSGWRATNGWVLDTSTGNWAPHVTDIEDPHYVAPGGHRFPAVIVTAAGLPITPLCVRYEEIYVHGVIRHRLGFTMNNIKVGGVFVWPGRGAAYTNVVRLDDEWGPTIPYAATLRLSAAWYHANVEEPDGTPIGTWGEGCRVMLRCLYDYGMMLTDGGGVADFWAIPDSRYHEEGRYTGDLVDLNTVPLGAFEVVDWGDPLVTGEVSPATADVGTPRTLEITYNGWAQHPGVEHPGYPDAEEWDPVNEWPVWPWQWLAHPRVYQWPPVTFASPAAGEPAHEDGMSVEIGPAHATAVFDYTPAVEDLRWFPMLTGFNPDWGYHAAGAYTVETTGEPPVVVVTPATATVAAGGTVQLTAEVTGATDPDVTWSVASGGGSVSSSGLYTAPGAATTATVRATSVEDPSAWDEATVTVSAPVVTVEVAPATANAVSGGTVQLTATVTGTVNQAVTWAVVPGPVGGSVNASGLYTAGPVAGTETVRATSQADPSKFDDATVTVTAAPDLVVSVSPSITTVYVGGTRQFAATVDALPSEDVTWSVASGVGTIDAATGLYTAPDAPGVATVRATSTADPDAYAEAAVTVVFPGDRHGPTQFLSVTDRVDPVFQGAAAAFTITLRDREGRLLTGVYDGTEGLDFDLWLGDDAAEADLGSSTVSWLDPDAGTVSVVLAGGDTALLEPPGYWFRLWLTDGGDKLGAFREWLPVEPSAGEGTALRVYGGFAAVVDEFGGAVDLINRSPNIKADLSDLRHKAARWVDGVALARIERDLRRQLREHGPIGWVEGPAIVDGVDHGPAWGPSTLVDPTLEEHLDRYRAAIEAGAVVRTPELEEIVTARALGYLLLGAAGADKESPYLGLGMSYKAQAARMLSGYTVRLDLDDDDVADAEARP